MAEVHQQQQSASSTPVAEEIPSGNDEAGFFQSLFAEIINSPLNIVLVILIAYLIYKILRSRSDDGVRNAPVEQELPKLRKDFTIQELKKFDGNQPDGRVLVAVNGHVYDVTKGKKFYGPGEFQAIKHFRLDSFHVVTI